MLKDAPCKKPLFALDLHFLLQAKHVALSRVRTPNDLISWDCDPSVIQLDPFYQQLLQWMDCVDVINPNPPFQVVEHPERICNDDINAPIPEHENDNETDPTSI